MKLRLLQVDYEGPPNIGVCGPDYGGIIVSVPRTGVSLVPTADELWDSVPL